MLAHQDADRLVTDYLSGLGQYIMTWIEKTLGSNQIEIFTKRSAIQFVLTVPAGEYRTIPIPNLHTFNQPEEDLGFSLHPYIDLNTRYNICVSKLTFK